MNFDSDGLRPYVDEASNGSVRLVEELGFEELSRVVHGQGGFRVCTVGWCTGYGEDEANDSNEIELHDECILYQ